MRELPVNASEEIVEKKSAKEAHVAVVICEARNKGSAIR